MTTLSFTCGLTTTDTMCLGSSGLSNAVTFNSSPQPLPGLHRPRLERLTAGLLFACGVDTQGSGWCWGLGSEGQLGAAEAFQSVPQPIQLRFPTP